MRIESVILGVWLFRLYVQLDDHQQEAEKQTNRRAWEQHRKQELEAEPVLTLLVLLDLSQTVTNRMCTQPFTAKGTARKLELLWIGLFFVS